jgi:hypothetical protein
LFTQKGGKGGYTKNIMSSYIQQLADKEEEEKSD